MNRKIKFRAWDKNKKAMILDIQKAYDGLINNREYGWISCFDDFLDSDKFKVMQYTGLIDKNGIEVYDGDIVYLYDEKCIISWHLGGWILNKVNKSDYDRLLNGYLAKRKNGQYYSDCIEVIGNVYENKELLEDGNVRS